ncbi:hypothetical protein ACHHYP_13636 [Achlya hypogyna]|uniref:Uncharacterized protein n=1 Tax=Achlya hypogyna TaxID=1202772 RepID=A0A1V9ZFM6_ACHHY|nr:hypothetical protein ACHHYP_13636 [Achlya hypogyna]
MHCNSSGNTEYVASATQLPLARACAKAAGMSLEDVLSPMAPLPDQVQRIAASADCQAWFEQLQTRAKAASCLELQLLSQVSWDMAVAFLRVASVPLAETSCVETDVQAGISTLFRDPNLMPCLSVSGLYSTFTMRTPPTHGQLEQARTTIYCQQLFANAQGVAANFPDCNIVQQGLYMNVHALANVSFDRFVDWGELVAAAASMTAPTAFAVSSSSTSLLAPFLVMAVLCSAMFGRHIHQQRSYGTSTADERARLLSPP